MGNKITVYGASWCGPCQAAKKYLNDRDIPYDYVDIDENPEAMPEGYQSIPLIVVGDEYISGFGPKLAAAIANQDL